VNVGPDNEPDPEAYRFEILLDLYAPVCEDEDTGTQYRDPSCGVITYEQFMVVMNADAGAA
jgi:hypothetical protein